MIERTHEESMNRGGARQPFVPASSSNMISDMFRPSLAIQHCSGDLRTTGLHAPVFPQGMIGVMQDCDVMVAGGAEATVRPSIGGSVAARTVNSEHDPKLHRDPGIDRDCFCSGEAEAKVLEEYDAKARGAKNLRGIGWFRDERDAYHMMIAPDIDGPSCRSSVHGIAQR
jgi:hypothetical protein